MLTLDVSNTLVRLPLPAGTGEVASVATAGWPTSHGRPWRRSLHPCLPSRFRLLPIARSSTRFFSSRNSAAARCRGAIRCGVWYRQGEGKGSVQV